MNKLIHYIKGKNNTKRGMPKHTGKIKPDDPYVYLDSDGCLIWMSSDGPQYMNEDGAVGGAHFDDPIVGRLGKFRGIAIELCDTPSQPTKDKV